MPIATIPIDLGSRDYSGTLSPQTDQNYNVAMSIDQTTEKKVGPVNVTSSFHAHHFSF